MGTEQNINYILPWTYFEQSLKMGRQKKGQVTNIYLSDHLQLENDKWLSLEIIKKTSLFYVCCRLFWTVKQSAPYKRVGLQYFWVTLKCLKNLYFQTFLTVHLEKKYTVPCTSFSLCIAGSWRATTWSWMTYSNLLNSLNVSNSLPRCISLYFSIISVIFALTKCVIKIRESQGSVLKRNLWF